MSPKSILDESKLYNLIVEYLEEKRELKLDSAIPYLKTKLRTNSFNINTDIIIKVLRSLIQHKLIVEGSRLVRYDLLNNSKRKKIYRFIVNNPGIFHYEIVKHFDISSHVVTWHLRVLKKFRLIKETNVENHVVYFDKAVTLYEVKKKYFLRRKKSQKIISTLNDVRDGMTKTAISRTLKMHPNTVKKYLKALQEIKILEIKEESNKTLYLLSNEYLNG
ncbi:MAG: hypothetical protein GF353_20430 [Candidatus Lokiarchaeota archaeon]|nr:hypothetical protein [Candidatus Lokiarchaeota archaeon]